MGDVSYKVRVMRKEEVPKILEIWKEIGLNEGKYCPYTWMAVDPEGFNVAVTDSGEVIAVCCGIIHNDDIAFVGMYACREKYRGRGIGLKVWKACIDHIGPHRNAAINAVPGKLDLYRTRGGFPVVETDWTIIANETNTIRPDHTGLSDTPPVGVAVLPFKDPHFPLILDYDLSLIGYSRELALRLTFREGESRTLVALKDGRCVGFGTIKLSIHNAAQIGPLYADDPEVAEVLLKRLIVAMPQATGFVMMTVDVNKPANELVRRVGCPVLGEVPRLYRRERMNADLSKVYGHLDLNFAPF